MIQPGEETFFDPATAAEIKRALDELVERGTVEIVYDREGTARYAFPDKEIGQRLLRESREGGQ
jgi:hypothetical protein